jgi:hypothetical protein
MKKKKALSLRDKAKVASGRSRACNTCPFVPCSLVLSRVCKNSFIDGYLKGYRQAKRGFVKPKQMIRITIEIEDASAVAFFRKDGELCFFEQLSREDQVSALNGLASVHKMERPLLKEK